MNRKYQLWSNLPYPNEENPTKKRILKSINSLPLFYFINIKDFPYHKLIKNPNDINWNYELSRLKKRLRNNAYGKEQQIKWLSDIFIINNWLSLILYLISEYELDIHETKRIIVVILLTLNDVSVLTWYLKFKYNVARPVQLDNKLIVFKSTPFNPSYPSGHASIAGALEVVLSYFFPNDITTINNLALKTAKGRVDAGVHFPIDIEEGMKFGRQLGKSITKRV